MDLTVAFHMFEKVGRVLTPLALESAVPADVTVTSLHVSVQKLPIQTTDVAAGTLDRATDAWRIYGKEERPLKKFDK